MFKLVSGEDLRVDKAQLKDSKYLLLNPEFILSFYFFVTVYETMGVSVASEEDFDEKFQQMDADKDGMIHYRELEEWFQIAVQQERGSVS